MLLSSGVVGVSGLRGAAARRRRSAGACSPCCAAPAGERASADPEQQLRKLPFLRRGETREGRRRALLGELAMLNERLSGGKPHEVRQRVEWIQRRRRNWELITDYVTRTDAAVTLSLIEAANAKVKEQLAEQARDSPSVADLVTQLEALQSQVAEAQQRAAVMEARVSANLARVRDLEAEARSRDAARAAGGVIVPPILPPAVLDELDECVATPGAGSACVDTLLEAPAPARARKGLDVRFADASSLALPSADSRLRHYWHPVTFMSKARDGEQLWAFGEQYTLRTAPENASGWTVLAQPAPGQGPARELPTAVMDGMLAVWPGSGPPTAPPPQQALLPPSHYVIHAEIVVDDVPAEHGLLIENLLDLAHAPFTHTGTFAKGWGVPDLVKFAADAARQPGDGWTDIGSWLAGGARGSWAPYPIDMAFEPPCCVISHVGLAQAGAAGSGAQFVPGTRALDCPKHLHQLHVCVPARPGRTRLLYRMALDFASWAKMVPGMNLVWSEMAAQVLGEDMRLVVGQQERMARGERVWANPVGYDKCGLAYRRFRNEANRPVSENDARPGRDTADAQPSKTELTPAAR